MFLSKDSLQRCSQVLFTCLALFVFADSCLYAQADDSAIFIEEFLLLEDQWDRWAEEAKPLTIEGRYKSVNLQHLYLEQCDLSFEAATGVNFRKEHDDSHIVKISGKLIKQKEKLQFEVARFETLPNLEEQLRLSNLKEDISAPELFYELARSFESYAHFYEAPELLKKANALYTSGLKNERHRLNEDESEGLFKLARKANELNLSFDLQSEFMHEGLWRLWTQVMQESENSPTFEQFLDRLLEKLPGAASELPEPNLAIKKQYLENPIKTYRQTDGFGRLELNRLFYIETVEKYLRSQLDSDASNGLEIAERLEELVPERRDVAIEIKKQGLQFRLDNIETATRSDMLSIREQFLQFENENSAKETAERWLKKREKLVLEEGPAGIPLLTDDLINLLGNKEHALKLLLATVRDYPDSTEVKQRLSSLGYAKIDGAWREQKKWEAEQENDPVLQAMRQGVVVEGMQLGQVEKTLGFPISRLQAVSKNSITEIWIYPQGGGQRLLVFFERIKSQPRLEAIVSKIVQK